MMASSEIPFTKFSACGNDFLIVDLADTRGNELVELSRRMCDRHNGVGADGVEWLFPDQHADALARLYNADGSEAEISGNGTRCVAAELCSRTGKTELSIRTGAGVKTCRLVRRQGALFEFETVMGKPEIGGQLSLETMWVRAVGTRVSMGNPHFVVFVDRFSDQWQREGALVQTQPQFPQGTNVEFVVVRGPNEIEIRLFERGVGETQSSGTGSCAAAVAAISAKKVSSPVRVVAPGGAQTVRWDDEVYLTGPAKLICRGEFII
jgi:diaminopimelate epimerase